MEGGGRKDFTLFQPRKALWDEDLSDFLLRLKYYFVMARATGLNSFPHELLKAEVSICDRIWSQLICAVSLALSVQAMLFFCLPSIVPDAYVPLKLNAKGNPFRYILPLFSVMMTILRYRVSILFSKNKYLGKIRQIAFDIIHDPVLSKLRVKPWKVRAYTSALFVFSTFSVVTHFLSSVTFRPDEWQSPMLYVTILEHQTYINVNIHVACYVLIIGFHVVLPLLRMTVREFERAAKTMDIPRLEAAIHCHETCCRLIRTVDCIASFFLGTMLIIAVPQFAITISSWDIVTKNKITLRQTLLYLIYQALYGILFLLLASSIYKEAQEPERILSARMYRNKNFEDLSSQFTRRFHNREFGLTFFGYFTFKKQSILNVLNIITTYLIVAMQMKMS